MDFSLLFGASAIVQTHLLFAVGAFLIGGIQLLLKKGTSLHKVLGRLWVVVMLIVSLTSFWIKKPMSSGIFLGFSVIHLLSVFVLVQLIRGVHFARVGNITGHQKIMTYMYIGGLIIAGAFTFYPGRLLHQVFVLPLLGV